MIGRRAVGTDQNEILDGVVGERRVAMDQVVPECGPLRNAEPETVAGAACEPPVDLAGREGEAGAVVFPRDALRLRVLLSFFHVLGIAETGVGLSPLPELRRGPLVVIQPPGLIMGALVPIDPQPAQSFQDRLGHVFPRPLQVGVLDPEDESPRLASSQEPVEERGPRASHVQEAGRAGGETDPNSHQSRALAAWPPNSRRSAAISRAEKGSSCLEAKRAKSEWAMAVAGTPRPTASSAVQRPSPESST